MTRTAGRFNTLKIVPMVTLQDILEECKQIENGTFFPTDAAAKWVIKENIKGYQQMTLFYWIVTYK
jgi:hypothetical protein